MMPKQTALHEAQPGQPRYQYVMCIDNTGYEADLTLFKVYRAQTSEKHAERGVLGVVDNTRESYLFAANRFVPVELPAETERAFIELMDRLDQQEAKRLAALSDTDLENNLENEEETEQVT
jgi:hypothetical protein